MLPFLDTVLGEWARREPVDAHELARPGPDGRLRLPARARTVSDPEGRELAVEGGGWFTPARAGNYRVTAGPRPIGAFAVNAPIRESDLDRGDPARLEAALPAADWHWIRADAPADWTGAVFRARRGRPAWKPLVALLLVSAILEAGLSASGRRRKRPADAATGKGELSR